MLRKFLIGTGAATTAATAVAGYKLSDPENRRAFDFWSRAGVVVFDYVQTAVVHKYYYKSTSTENTEAFRLLHEKNAPKALQIILDLRGIFIKAGQYLSVRPELTPEPYRRQFKTLQTMVPSVPLDVILGVVEKEMGQPISEMFSHVETKPCGAASTAQAHVAVLKETGETVVIKVQYPDAEAHFKSDITSLSQLARLINYFDQLRNGNDVKADELDPIIKEFSKQFLAEFDYEAEKQNMMDIGNALRKSGRYNDTIIVPTVFPLLCSPRVITMTFLPGPTLEGRAAVLLKKMGVDFKNPNGIKNLLQMNDKKESETETATTNGNAIKKQQNMSRVKKVISQALSMIGPNAALQLWSMVDTMMTLWRRTAVFILLDVLHFSPGHYNQKLLLKNIESNPNHTNQPNEINEINKTSDNGVLPLESWGEWAGRTRHDLNQLDMLTNIHTWLNVLLDVHGFEIFNVGIFNGDPHPGNILVLDDDRLGLIDYGQVKRLSSTSQLKLARLVCLVADSNSTDLDVANAFRDFGVRTKKNNTKFTATMARLMLGQLKPQHMNHDWHMQLHKMDRMVVFPPDMMIFVRVAMLLRGMGLLLKQNVSVSERWQKEAQECITRFEKQENQKMKATKEIEAIEGIKEIKEIKEIEGMEGMVQKMQVNGKDMDVTRTSTVPNDASLSTATPLAISPALFVTSTLRPFYKNVLSKMSSFPSLHSRYMASSSTPTPPVNQPVSPYTLFNLSKRATETDIRTKFRELAYENHPDLNPDADDGAMTEIVEAYQILLSNTGAGAARDSSVSINVEKFTIHELMQDKEHTVIKCIVSLDDMLASGDVVVSNVTNDTSTTTSTEKKINFKGDENLSENRLTDLMPKVSASKYDSVADLKRDLQQRFEAEWGLEGRRQDTEQVAIGWELVHDGNVLCPNYFLGDYSIKSGDLIHAVIRNK